MAPATCMNRPWLAPDGVLGDDHPYTLTSMNNVAEIRRVLGDLPGAQALHEQTLAARRQHFGDDHPDKMNSMNNLALTRYAVGDLDGARQLLEQALAGYRRVLDEDHPNSLRSMNNLASILEQSSATWTAPASCTNRPWPPASGCWALSTPRP